MRGYDVFEKLRAFCFKYGGVEHTLSIDKSLSGDCITEAKFLLSDVPITITLMEQDYWGEKLERVTVKIGNGELPKFTVYDSEAD